ncbi:hypothetical protein [Thermococcus sp. P6]|uniref:hypothetical protein n=1 Tax=Thermococcus sp. P6 TaxID=122420 RepID=UPI0012FE6FFE|nr:hypothetical protein [Thermococcus sp. P6]
MLKEFAHPGGYFLDVYLISDSIRDGLEGKARELEDGIMVKLRVAGLKPGSG